MLALLRVMGRLLLLGEKLLKENYNHTSILSRNSNVSSGGIKMLDEALFTFKK